MLVDLRGVLEVPCRKIWVHITVPFEEPCVARLKLHTMTLCYTLKGSMKLDAERLQVA